MRYIGWRILLAGAAVGVLLTFLTGAIPGSPDPASFSPHPESASSPATQPSALAPSPTAVPPTPQMPALVDISQSLRIENGKVLEGEFLSTTLAMTLPYRIYLPPGYDSSVERYPAVYLLHGNGGAYVEWTAYNHAALFADALISEGRIRPMILVMPEGDHSYFMNHAVDGQRWGDYVAVELVDYIDRHFRTVAAREGRAIGGLSMGGTGALQLAFNHPDRFSIAKANSPSLRLNLLDVPDYFGDPEYYARFDPISLAGTRADQIRNLDISIDIGEQDEWFGAAEQLHEALEENGVEHQFLTRYGYHWTTYWIEHGPEYLTYYSQALGRRLDELPSAWIDSPAERGVALSRKIPPEPESVRKAIQAVIRGARVCAALPDSPYMERNASEAMATLREHLAQQDSSTLEKTTALFAELEEAVGRMDIGAMRHLSDKMEGALDEEAPETP